LLSKLSAPTSATFAGNDFGRTEMLDNASISTVHSFADRLRLRPIDAQLSPAYDIAEDPDPLVEKHSRTAGRHCSTRAPRGIRGAALSEERWRPCACPSCELRVRP
jgi:hypothetical protein